MCVIIYILYIGNFGVINVTLNMLKCGIKYPVINTARLCVNAISSYAVQMT